RIRHEWARAVREWANVTDTMNSARSPSSSVLVLLRAENYMPIPEIRQLLGQALSKHKNLKIILTMEDGATPAEAAVRDQALMQPIQTISVAYKVVCFQLPPLQPLDAAMLFARRVHRPLYESDIRITTQAMLEEFDAAGGERTGSDAVVLRASGVAGSSFASEALWESAIRFYVGLLLFRIVLCDSENGCGIGGAADSNVIAYHASREGAVRSRVGICYDFARNEWVARYGVTIETFPLIPGQLDAKLPKFEAAFEMAAQWFNKQCEIHRRRASLLNEQAAQSAENERGLSGQAEKRPNSTAGDHLKTKKPKSAAPKDLSRPEERHEKENSRPVEDTIMEVAEGGVGEGPLLFDSISNVHDYRNDGVDEEYQVTGKSRGHIHRKMWIKISQCSVKKDEDTLR
ncbi:hypothetical protein FOZ62_027123, partial [Perkinsus olseni]